MVVVALEMYDVSAKTSAAASAAVTAAEPQSRASAVGSTTMCMGESGWAELDGDAGAEKACACT